MVPLSNTVRVFFYKLRGTFNISGNFLTKLDTFSNVKKVFKLGANSEKRPYKLIRFLVIHLKDD